MKRMLWGVALMVLGTVSCGGERVALNERLFAIGTMEREGGGCSLYELGSGNEVSVGSGAIGGALQVQQRLSGDNVIVTVNEGDRIVVDKIYSESFFKAGSLDEYSVTPAAAGTGLLLRYWGKLAPNGVADCAPLDDLGPL